MGRFSGLERCPLCRGDASVSMTPDGMYRAGCAAADCAVRPYGPACRSAALAAAGWNDAVRRARVSRGTGR